MGITFSLKKLTNCPSVRESVRKYLVFKGVRGKYSRVKDKLASVLSLLVFSKSVDNYILKIYQNLKQIEKSIMFAQLSDDNLLVRTKDIYCQKVNLGHFLININLRSMEMVIKNELLHKQGHMIQHPHVKEWGSGICWGNTKDTVTHFKYTMMMGNLVSTILSFLSSYNHYNCFAKLVDIEKRINEIKKI